MMNRLSPNARLSGVLLCARLSGVLLCALAALAVIALPGCEALKAPSVTQQLTVQYATGKFIEAEKGQDAKVARARAVVKVAENLKTVASSDSATIAQLRDLALAKVAKANLMPSDRLLANALVEVAVQELAARVSTGALDPDAKVAVSRLLDWVIVAASAYG